MLLSPSNDVVALATNMYNSSGGTGNATSAYSTANEFGMSSLVATQCSTSPFACNAAGFSRSNGDVFAGPQNYKPIINGQNQSASVGNIFGEPQSSSTGNIFSANQTSSSNASTIFGGNIMSTNTPFQLSANIFGVGSGPKTNPIFGGPATFGSNQCGNVFGHSNKNNSQASTVSTNIFGQNCPTSPSFPSTGSQNGGDIFRSSALQNVFSPANSFTIAEAAQMPPPLSVTKALGPAQTSISTEMANSTSDQSLFSSTAFNHSAHSAIESHIFSKTDDTNPKDLMAFRDNFFKLNEIPIVPPPYELCN